MVPRRYLPPGMAPNPWATNRHTDTLPPTRRDPPGVPAMPVSIRQIHPAFAGEVTGVDCTQPLSAANVAAIEKGMDQHAGMVFPDQPLQDDQQVLFPRHFGELEGYRTGGHIRARDDARLGPGM